MAAEILVTGGAGFIGSNFILEWVRQQGTTVINLDALTYAGNLCNLMELAGDQRHVFIHGDIRDRGCVRNALKEFRPRSIVHFAAESHVDRSILGPLAFIETNVLGTFTLLECAREYWRELPDEERAEFRFLHVSTDEVYGSLGGTDPRFTERSNYAPNSPYAASKAASDHLVRSYYHTYGLPTLTTNCSNNYGPYQFPEKLVPLIVLNGLKCKPLPIYGDGLNVRDWLYVKDHCAAIREVLVGGTIGETYNIGGDNERTNLDVVRAICDLLDELKPNPNLNDRKSLITYIKDRPGHDRRYAIDATKLTAKLGWQAKESFATGLRKTVSWYLENLDWVDQVQSGAYQQWIDLNYGARASVSKA